MNNQKSYDLTDSIIFKTHYHYHAYNLLEEID